MELHIVVRLQENGKIVTSTHRQIRPGLPEETYKTIILNDDIKLIIWWPDGHPTPEIEQACSVRFIARVEKLRTRR